MAAASIAGQNARRGHRLCQQDNAESVLGCSAMRATAKTRTYDAHVEAGLDVLASGCAARLRARLARPERDADDCSIELPAGSCACGVCCRPRTFLTDRNRRAFEWPLAKDGRQHVHSRIDSAEPARPDVVLPRIGSSGEVLDFASFLNQPREPAASRPSTGCSA